MLSGCAVVAEPRSKFRGQAEGGREGGGQRHLPGFGERCRRDTPAPQIKPPEQSRLGAGGWSGRGGNGGCGWVGEAFSVTSFRRNGVDGDVDAGDLDFLQGLLLMRKIAPRTGGNSVPQFMCQRAEKHVCVCV